MSYPERSGREPSHAAQGAFVVLAILFAAFMFGIGVYVGQNSEPHTEEGGAGVTITGAGEDGGGGATGGDEEETETETGAEEDDDTATETEAETETAADGGGAEEGESIFASAGCGSCHTLDEAGSGGTIGPNLDETSLDRAAIEQKIRVGGGAMPAFEGTLDDAQIAAVADFVDASRG